MIDVLFVLGPDVTLKKLEERLLKSEIKPTFCKIDNIPDGIENFLEIVFVTSFQSTLPKYEKVVFDDIGCKKLMLFNPDFDEYEDAQVEFNKRFSDIQLFLYDEVSMEGKLLDHYSVDQVHHVISDVNRLIEGIKQESWKNKYEKVVNDIKVLHGKDKKKNQSQREGIKPTDGMPFPYQTYISELERLYSHVSYEQNYLQSSCFHSLRESLNLVEEVDKSEVKKLNDTLNSLHKPIDSLIIHQIKGGENLAESCRRFRVKLSEKIRFLRVALIAITSTFCIFLAIGLGLLFANREYFNLPNFNYENLSISFTIFLVAALAFVVFSVCLSVLIIRFRRGLVKIDHEIKSFKNNEKKHLSFIKARANEDRESIFHSINKISDQTWNSHETIQETLYSEQNKIFEKTKNELDNMKKDRPNVSWLETWKIENNRNTEKKVS